MIDCLCLYCKAITPHREERPNITVSIWICDVCNNVTEMDFDIDIEDEKLFYEFSQQYKKEQRRM